MKFAIPTKEFTKLFTKTFKDDLRNYLDSAGEKLVIVLDNFELVKDNYFVSLNTNTHAKEFVINHINLMRLLIFFQGISNEMPINRLLTEILDAKAFADFFNYDYKTPVKPICELKFLPLLNIEITKFEKGLSFEYVKPEILY